MHLPSQNVKVPRIQELLRSPFCSQQSFAHTHIDRDSHPVVSL